MLGASFKEYIINRYGLYNGASGAFKYVHCDLIFVSRYLTITLTMGSTFVSTFHGHFNVGGYIKMSIVENVLFFKNFFILMYSAFSM
jgi:hypothetical protein